MTNRVLYDKLVRNTVPGIRSPDTTWSYCDGRIPYFIIKLRIFFMADGEREGRARERGGATSLEERRSDE